MVSMLTAVIIKNRGDDIKCEGGGPSRKNGKYAGWIQLYRGDEFDHSLLSTDAIFDSKEDATEKMEEIVRTIRETEIPGLKE